MNEWIAVLLGFPEISEVVEGKVNEDATIFDREVSKAFSKQDGLDYKEANTGFHFKKIYTLI
jgi:hypothetical protein